MKELVKILDKFADLTQIELSKWTREVLYTFLTDLLLEIRDKNDV